MSTSVPDPNYFVDLNITTDQGTLEDNAIEALRAAWPDWEPNDGDLEVKLIEAIGPIGANAAQVASQIPMQALIAAGALFNVPMQTGAPASTTVTFTVQDTAGGYLISAGSQLIIDGFTFKVLSDLTTAIGDLTVDGEVIADENSTDYNALTGVSVAPLSMPPYVVLMTVDSPTSGGVDPQTMVEYASDLSQELQLLIRTICTLPDFEIAATAIDGIARAHAVTDSARNITVWLLSTNPPTAVSTALKDELAAIYAANRIVNITVALDDPTFTAINVVWAATIYAGFDPTDFVARVNAALAVELSALGWGVPPAGDPGNVATQWFANSTVRAARLATVISQVQGCYDVDSVAINGHPAGTNVTMTGTVALPTPGTFTGTTTTLS